MRKRLGITARLVLTSVCIFVALGLTVTWHSVSRFRSLLYEQIVRRVEAQALNWIDVNLTQITVTRDRSTLMRLIGALKNRKGIAYVVLLNEQGRTLAENGVPAGLSGSLAAATVSGLASQVTQRKDAATHRYFELTTPISVAGTGMSGELGRMFEVAAPNENGGTLRVGIDAEEIDRSLGPLVPRTILLYAALILLALAVNIGLARRIVTPITAMGRIANQIAAGNLDERVQLGADLQDEVGELVRNFNKMADRLAENREEMQLLYAGLEEKVRERTKELEQANRRLQELDNLKSDFVSRVSHELRTPLTPIKALTEILLDSPNPDPATRKRFLEIIYKESDRLSRLISDLLDLAKIESGTVNWRMIEVDLTEIVAEAILPLTALAAEKDIELVVGPSERQLVWADADRIQQVVTNLVGNAIKFSGKGGRIEVRLDRTVNSGPRRSYEGQYAIVAVSDSGPGIPPEQKEHVFEKFQGGARNRPPGAGTGLGLAISQEIISHHKGEIWMKSEVGVGSTFYFTLPLRIGTTSDTQAPSQAEGRA